MVHCQSDESDGGGKDMKKVSVTLKVDLDEVLSGYPLHLSTLRNWHRLESALQDCNVTTVIIIPVSRIKDVNSLPGFVPASKYGQVRAEPNEIGAVEVSRFVVPERRAHPWDGDRRRRV